MEHGKPKTRTEGHWFDIFKDAFKPAAFRAFELKP